MSHGKLLQLQHDKLLQRVRDVLIQRWRPHESRIEVA